MRRIRRVFVLFSAAPLLLSAVAAAQTIEEPRFAVLDGISLIESEPFAASPALSLGLQDAPSKSEPVPEPVRPPGRRRFFTAAGELVLIEAIPWAWNRYVAREDFARISWDTIRKNFEDGFGYDPDTFEVNQSSHPYHGSLFFNAARENGYGFWESSAFTLAGSLIWEYFMENTRPSTNDLVNTTLGGMARGEVAHRLSNMIIDNESTGKTRLIREIAAGVINPAALLNRLLRGEAFQEFNNAPVIANLALDEQLGLALERYPEVLVELWIQRGVGREPRQILEFQPVTDEVFNQG